MILFISTFYSNLTVKGSLYDAEILFIHEKEANSIFPKNWLKTLLLWPLPMSEDKLDKNSALVFITSDGWSRAYCPFKGLESREFGRQHISLHDCEGVERVFIII